MLFIPRGGVVVFVLLTAWFVSAGNALAQPVADDGAEQAALSIRVAQGAWNNARRADIEQVLLSAARELEGFFPQRSGDVIRIEHANSVPKVLYERGPAGEYVVQLTASGMRWAAYAYEFSHELCHIYANYQFRQNTAEAAHQWFEESLCEAASLFVLRRMAVSWQSSPPYPHWRDYAPAFAEYAQALLDEPHRHGDMPLGSWYAQHTAVLSRNPYDRASNEYCATRLLDLFESHPQGWAALHYLNTPTFNTPRSAAQGFDDYLRRWHDAAPARQRPFLTQLLAMFALLPEAQRLAAVQ
jgi:hypothetical protein